MAEEINALIAIADQLIQSDPLKQESWDKDLSACLPIAKAHLHSWSTDIQHRDDRRARKKNRVWSSKKNYGSSSLNQYIGSNFINDSKLETMAIRHLRAEPQGLNKAKNSLANACAEIFLSRTSIPYYHGEPSAYPFLAPNDADVTSKAKDVWVYLRESSGSLSDSTSHNFTKFKHYFSVPVRVALLVESGLLNQENASRVMKKVYPHGLYVPIVQHGNPSIQSDLGAHLHTLGHPEDKLHLAAIACRGVFSALFTWNRFNSVLVQGGWPWLRQYSRAYAKMIYTVMVLMFAAIENYDMNDMVATRTRILALAGKLVGSQSGDRSQWTVRKSVYLRGPKVTIPARPEAKAINGQVTHGDAGGLIPPLSTLPASDIHLSGEKSSAKQPGHAVDTIPWKHLHTPSPPLPQPLPSHIVKGARCAHTHSGPFTGRINVAHSLSDLEAATADCDGITVALTWGVESARRKVWTWVAQKAMMTVQVAEGQCISCAVESARCIGALVVVG